MIKYNLLKSSFVWDFYDKRLIKATEMFKFLHLINNSVTIGLFFINRHISNHIIKSNKYLTFLIWVLFFNVFINIIHIIRVFNKRLRIIKML